MQNIKVREVISYAVMPRIVPRLKTFFTSGFGYISFLMAQVYSIVRLIPSGHPYLKTENMGCYGVRHVVAEASRNLTYSVKNIDQFIIFFAMLAGLVILVVQFILFAYALFIMPSMAASWFDTVQPDVDIAFNLLDQIFGIPDIYCSTSAPATCTQYSTLFPLPLPFHTAMHGLFQFYSTALLLIAVLIFLYFIVVVIVETAVTGTPFGQRFQNVWVPVRLVVAIGLLMPINFGLNSGQYIVLYTAKYGSGLATNGWLNYNAAVSAHKQFGGGPANPLGERYSYLAIPEVPDVTPLLEAMTLVHACAYAYHRINSAKDTATFQKVNVTRGGGPPYPAIDADYTAALDPWTFQVSPFLVKNTTAGFVTGQIGVSPIFNNDAAVGIVDEPWRRWVRGVNDPPYWAAAGDNALGFYYGNDIIIRFGEYKVTDGTKATSVETDETGSVIPLCGDIRIPIFDLTDPGGSYAGPNRGGADQMQRFYYELVLTLWFDTVSFRQVGRTLVEKAIANNHRLSEFCSTPESGTAAPLAARGGPFASFYAVAPATDCFNFPFSSKWRTEQIADATFPPGPNLEVAIAEAWENYVLYSTYAEFTTGAIGSIASRGWGGAGIWYNKIAEINGGWMDSVRGVPYMDKYPRIMEEVRAFNVTNNAGVQPLEVFNPSVPASGEESAPKPFKVKQNPHEIPLAAIPLNAVFVYWNPPSGPKDGSKVNQVNTENILIDAMNMMLGINGLLDIRQSNQYLHPMAQLVAVGKALVNAAVFGMAASTVSAFLGGAARAINKNSPFAGAGDAASQVFFAVAFMGLTAGFVLFYVLPFLPFMYFYFAVASWVKAIFEAMLGVPLWALSHLRLDGDGLPGDSASNGYFLILEIFIRPILTVFGLLAAIIIFSTQVQILNLVWDVVVDNAAGYTEVDNILGAAPSADYIQTQRGPLDKFFFTVVYTMVCYMLALASFKLIDKVPDNILRWAGAGVSSYGDIDQDHVESLSRYAATGGMTIGSQGMQAVTSTAKSSGAVVGGQIAKFLKTPDPQPPAPKPTT